MAVPSYSVQPTYVQPSSSSGVPIQPPQLVQHVLYQSPPQIMATTTQQQSHEENESPCEKCCLLSLMGVIWFISALKVFFFMQFDILSCTFYRDIIMHSVGLIAGAIPSSFYTSAMKKRASRPTSTLPSNQQMQLPAFTYTFPRMAGGISVSTQTQGSDVPASQFGPTTSGATNAMYQDMSLPPTYDAPPPPYSQE